MMLKGILLNLRYLPELKHLDLRGTSAFYDGNPDTDADCDNILKYYREILKLLNEAHDRGLNLESLKFDKIECYVNSTCKPLQQCRSLINEIEVKLTQMGRPLA